MLTRLIEAHPELLAEAAALADTQLAAVDSDNVADEIADAFGALCVEDIWERSGARAHGEYVEPSEAAWDLIEETLAPFLAELERRVALARGADATAYCRGALLRLYRVGHGDGEFLQGHAPDAIEEAAGSMLDAWKKLRPRNARTWDRRRESESMSQFFSRELPEWESFLKRALGRVPAKARKERKR